MKPRSRWVRPAAASLIALTAATLATYFLIDSTRAAGGVLIAVTIGLATYLALGRPGANRRDPNPLRTLVLGTGVAVVVVIAGFALALGLLLATRA